MLMRELTDDGLHPNDAGYELIAPLAENAIAVELAHLPGRNRIEVQPHVATERGVERLQSAQVAQGGCIRE
jgi:hypothetical protein